MSPATDPPLVDQVRRLYVSGDPPFEAVLKAHPAGDDEALADLIDADGRVRLSRRLETPLDRYLRVLTEPHRRPVALDAAIDFALRAAAARGQSETEAAAKLKARFPALAQAIDAATEFSRALTSTDGVAGREEPTLKLRLPCDLGPLCMTGQPRYKLKRQLASGSQGTAYVAEDRQLSAGAQPALVCVKILALEISHDDPHERVVGEAMKARRINHLSVVRVLDRGVFHGHEYIVYELIEGRTLTEWIAAHPGGLKPIEAVRLMVQVADGVQAAHAAGLVHRDLKPDNILMTADGVPKITDFGAAAIVSGRAPDRFGGPEAPASSSTRALRGPVGNLAFMAPEQFWMSPGGVAPSADLYALGGILWHMLTGRLPNGDTPEEVRRKHSGMSGPAAAGGASAELRHPGIDSDLAAICGRALAPSADLRYSSADALAADLRAWLERRPIAWLHPTLARRAGLAVRRQPLLVLLLAAMATLGAMTAWVLHLASRMAAEQQAVRTPLSQPALNQSGLAGLPGRRGESGPGLSGIEHERAVGRAALSVFKRLGGDGSLLPVLAAMEGPASARDTAARVELARAVLDQIERERAPDDLESLSWRLALGVRLLRDQHGPEAHVHLSRALERLKRLRPSDVAGASAIESLLALSEPSALKAASGAAPGDGAAGAGASTARTRLLERVRAGIGALSAFSEFDDLRRALLDAAGVLPINESKDALWPSGGGASPGGEKVGGG